MVKYILSEKSVFIGGKEELPDDWKSTAAMIKKTDGKIFGVSSGEREDDIETRWCNSEVQEVIQRKKLTKKKWDSERTEESRQEYKEMQFEQRSRYQGQNKGV